MKGKSMIRTWE